MPPCPLCGGAAEVVVVPVSVADSAFRRIAVKHRQHPARLFCQVLTPLRATRAEAIADWRLLALGESERVRELERQLMAALGGRAGEARMEAG